MNVLKVCIDARLISGTAGGVEHFIIGLAYGLSQLEGDSECYSFLTYPGQDRWIAEFMNGPCNIIHTAHFPQASSSRVWLSKKLPRLNHLIKKIYPFSHRWSVRSLVSDGVIEKAGMNVMHFTHQVAFITRVPSIYHPHDLQHKHLPFYFSPLKIFVRDFLYKLFCRRAKFISVASSWIKIDLINSYGILDEKVKVIHFAPPLSATFVPTFDELNDVREKFSLCRSFLFYPAQTWPHKNHLKLLDAVAALKYRDGIVVPVVFSGSISNSFFSIIKNHIDLLNINQQVTFVGFITAFELKCIYHLSRCVVVPTKYEAGSFPIWEAFELGVPVACSNVTSLPAQVGDAALIFDPDSVDDIGAAVKLLWTDESLRELLIERGRKNVARFTWTKTARTFRAYYRLIASRPLTDEDCLLIKDLPLI